MDWDKVAVRASHLIADGLFEVHRSVLYPRQNVVALYATAGHDYVMATTRLSLSDQIRRAVKACGMSQYRICQEIDLHKSVLSRFMAGHCGLSVGTLDRLGKLLGLQVVASAKTSRRKAGA